MKGKGKVLLIIWAVLMTFVAGGLVGFEVMRVLGKSNLESKSATSAPMMGQQDPYAVANTGSVWQDDWVSYNGEVYDYNEDITTFLIMGIDSDDEVVSEKAPGTGGGQADALFLLVLNPRDKSIKIVGINRNAMTDVDIYDEYGRYQTTVEAQVSLQHGFGDGMEKSCEYQVQAVSKLFNQLPIHGYAAVNMSAISTINDAVGGVDVTVLDDLTKFDKRLIKGRQVHLEGDMAFNYVKSRDIYVPKSNDMRLERQKQYLSAFISAARDLSKDNKNALVELFTAISSKMVTNISVDEISYLSPYITSYSFDTEGLRIVEGTTEKPGKYEEFYVDKDKLYELILDVFYEKVDYVG